MLCKNFIPFINSQVMGQSANAGAPSVSPYIRFVFIVFAVLRNMLNVFCLNVIALCVFVFPLLAFLGFVSKSVKQSNQVWEFNPSFSHTIAPLLAKLIVVSTDFAVALSAQPMTMMWFHLAAVVALADFARLNVIVITRVTQAARAQLTDASALFTNNFFTFACHSIT